MYGGTAIYRIARRQVKFIIAECQLLYRGGDFFVLNRCQGSKHSAAHLYPNIRRLPPSGSSGAFVIKGFVISGIQCKTYPGEYSDPKG